MKSRHFEQKTPDQKHTPSRSEIGVSQVRLDGELDAQTLATVHRHLAACRKCGMQARTYQAIKDSIASHGQRPLPAGIVADLAAFARDVPNQ